ncbi:MAG: hypothetical protein KDA31_13045 [Phycisphaerales bacterium]|nr:hypothetical protein [Phycisphaerales bacterium]
MTLTYELVDDIAFAAEQPLRVNLGSHLLNAGLELLGPMIEYAWLRRSLRLPSLVEALSTPLSERFHAFTAEPPAICNGSLNDGSPFDFAHLPTSEEGFTSHSWISFKSRMMFAAETHGFSRAQAAALAGAMGEMASNAFEHSQRPCTAIAAFNASPAVFEFVVADAGIGAAASLRACPEFGHIHDPGEALVLCISEGISRHGHDAKRGLGFQVLFARLADLNARVRLRSENQVIDLRGDCLGPRWAIPAGRPPIQGMLISAQCFPPT